MRNANTFAGPSGRPKFIRERLSTSSTTLSLVWEPPPLASLNAEFRGYQLTYKPSNHIASNTSQVQINVKDAVNIQVILKFLPRPISAEFRQEHQS